MNLADTRTELNDRWEDASIWGDDHKDPYYAHEHIERVFRAASGERRAEMEQVLCEWLGSEESDRRMSAWTLLHEGFVMAAVAPLKDLGERLAISDTPWGRHERRVVLDAATEIEAANGYHQLVCDEARTREAASDAVDRLDAERKAWHERSPVHASVDELAYAADVLWAGCRAATARGCRHLPRWSPSTGLPTTRSPSWCWRSAAPLQMRRPAPEVDGRASCDPAHAASGTTRALRGDRPAHQRELVCRPVGFVVFGVGPDTNRRGGSSRVQLMRRYRVRSATRTSRVRDLAIAGCAVLAVALASASPAAAAAPILKSVGQNRLHSTGTFSAPGAEYVVVYLATSPERGTDGRFLRENSSGTLFLSDAEIAAGSWLDSGTIDPGVLYVMIRASSFCSADTVCADGFSDVLRLDVPEPARVFSRTLAAGTYAVDLTLTVSPAGEDLPYKLCWTRTRGRGPRCKHRTVRGGSWTSDGSDTVSLFEGDLRLSRGQRKTTFNWYVDGRKVASRKASLGQLFD